MKKLSIFILSLLFLALCMTLLSSNALAMVPGPTEDDDKPPAKPSTTDTVPVFDAKLPKNTVIPNFAQMPSGFYARCLSLGTASHGALRDGVMFPRENQYYTTTRADRQWGTPESVDALIYAASKVYEKVGPSHRLVLGDISTEDGGRRKAHEACKWNRDDCQTNRDHGKKPRDKAGDRFPTGQCGGPI